MPGRIVFPHQIINHGRKLPEQLAETRTELKTDDVLISITADIGFISYVSASVPKPAYISQLIALIRFDRPKTNGKYVSYFLASERPAETRSAADPWRQSYRLASNGIGRARWRRDERKGKKVWKFSCPCGENTTQGHFVFRASTSQFPTGIALSGGQCWPLNRSFINADDKR